MSLLDVDTSGWETHYGRAPMLVGHNLVDEPRLELDALARLAAELPAVSFEHNRSDVPEVVPEGTPPLGRDDPRRTVLSLVDQPAWVVLWNIEQVPAYRDLLDGCLDEVLPLLRRFEPDMHKREGFVFISSAGSVTPSHSDPEHNFLLQVRGTKYMTIGGWPDGESRTREIERKYAGGTRNLPFPPTDPKTFTLTPGLGVYVPSHAPHVVHNGDELCIALSVTFRTPATERADRVYELNARLRRLGIRPRPPGPSPRVDEVKAGVQRMVAAVQRRLP